jgi:two-component system LytT family response regulator
MKMNALIIDDEYAGRNTLLTLLRQHCAKEVDEISTVESLEEAKKALVAEKYDVVFLDIQLKNKSGFELIKFIPATSKVIFVTAYSEYAVKAIKSRAFDYILKPVDPEELVASVQQCNQAIQQIQKLYLTIKIKGRTVPLELSNIVYIKGNGPYAEINYATGNVYVTSQTLKTLSPKLNEHFIRVHKSFIVNRNFITGYNQKELFLENLCVPLSRPGLLSLQEYFSS